MKFIRCWAFVVALCFGGLAVFAQDAWVWRSPTPTGNRLVSFAYGNGQFVGVGENGAILTSPDGATWTHRESGVEGSLKRVVFDGIRFVAVGGTSILTSADGLTWNAQTAPSTLLDIAHGNGTFVVLAAAASTDAPNRFLTSTSAVSWTVRENSTDVSPSRVLFANGTFVAVDDIGHALYSTDTVSWTPVTLTSNGRSMHCAAGNHAFLVAFSEHIFRSSNGATWTDITAANSGHPICGSEGSLGFADARFYVDEGEYDYGVFSSADGLTWSAVSDHAPNAYVLDLATLASGGGVTIASESPRSGPANLEAYFVHYSAHGLPAATSWSNQYSFPTSDGAGGSHVVYGLGRYFFAGRSSPDGVTWADCGFAPTHVAGERLFRIVSNLFGSVVPEITSINGAITTVEVSADGLTARSVDVRIPTPRSVAFGAARYVMVGDDGKISTSTDAMTWTVTNSGTTKNLNAVLFAFDRFIAVGDDGTLISSLDGRTWAANSVSPGNFRLTGIAANVDRIVVAALTGSGVASLTLDGTGIPISVAAGNYVALTYYSGNFLAISYESPSDPGNAPFYRQRLWKSVEGFFWTAIPLHLGPVVDTVLPAFASGNGTTILQAQVGAEYLTHFDALLQTPYVGSGAPVITCSPVPVTVDHGATARFSLGVTGSGPFVYQWYYDGVLIPGATQSVLTLANVTAGDAGAYSVVVTNPFGSATSTAGSLLVLPLQPLPEGARLVNLSARAFAGEGDDTLIEGFVLRGESSGASPNVLVRSIGPTLETMGVSGALTDPSIQVLDTQRFLVAANDNWSTVDMRGRGIAATSSDMAQFGSFSLAPGSRDSAVLIHEAPAGAYTALVSSGMNGTGIVLNEVYGPTSGPQRLVNLSARARVSSGDKILIAGFVIGGSAPLKILIRGVGPTLVTQGITSPLANPKITLFNHAGVEIHNNDNWGQASNLADLRTATKAVGAFTLNENSYDAAMLETLQPGVYTVHVSSADATSGVALVEIYEAP